MLRTLLIAAAIASGAQRTPADVKWHVTAVSFCRYTIDIHDKPEPHLYLETRVGATAIVCPFVGVPRTATVLQVNSGAVCLPSYSDELTTLDAKSMTVHKFIAQIRSCLPELQEWLPENVQAARDVRILTINDQNSQDYGRVAAEISEAQHRTGLPVERSYSVGLNNTTYFCFEMMQGAHLDLLDNLRKAGVNFGKNVSDRVDYARTCTGALQGKLGPGEFPHVSFSILIKAAAGDAFTGNAFKTAVSEGLAEANLPGLSRDSSYVPLAPNDRRLLILTSLTNDRADISTLKLSPIFCNIVFGILQRTQGFIPPADDQSPTIILRETSSSEPPRYIAIAIQKVGSSGELCSALRPAFDRLGLPQGAALTSR